MDTLKIWMSQFSWGELVVLKPDGEVFVESICKACNKRLHSLKEAEMHNHAGSGDGAEPPH